MNLHLIAAAEKLRIAAELARGARELLKAGSVVNMPELAARASEVQGVLNRLWLDVAVLAGAEYQAELDLSHPETVAGKLSVIFALALQIPRDGVEALLTNPRFLFKSTAQAVLEIADELAVQSGNQVSIAATWRDRDTMASVDADGLGPAIGLAEEGAAAGERAPLKSGGEPPHSKAAPPREGAAR